MHRFCLLGLVAFALSLPSPLRAEDFSDPPSFVNDVEPLFTRLGCNQGACHGKGSGQNGFRLSLRGYAPELDHKWLTREYAARRISLVSPEDSELLRKPLGEAPHAGGKLFDRDSPANRLLLAWISAGAPGPAKEERKLERLSLDPQRRLAKPNDAFPIRVTAHYDDGSQRDVTWLAQFASNDPALVSVDAEGRVRVDRPGETVVRVHFQGLVATTLVTVPYDHAAPELAAPANIVDQHVFARLKELRIPASPPCDDTTFIRRVFLDLTGTLPTEPETRAFLAESSADKRAKLIEALLARPEFVDYWTLVWSDLFQNRKERDHDVRGVKGVRAFHAWLRKEVASNTPWDKLAAKVLTARGNTQENPQVGYYVVTVGEFHRPEQSDVVASVAQAFLGTRIGCAKCHNHPLEKYTQDDFYHFAACFARVGFDRQKSEVGPTELMLATLEELSLQRRIKQIDKKIAELEAQPRPEPTDDAKREELKKFDEQLAGQRKQREDAEKQLDEARLRPIGVSQPRTGQMMEPQGLDRQPLEVAASGDPREGLVRWMTDGNNPDFNGAIVNRLWRHFLGVGMVEPVDDLRASNPPSNPELWQALCEELVSHRYDLKHVMRLILNSQTYQRSSETLPENETDARYYSHYYARRLPAEVLLDAITQVTGAPDRFPGYPLGVRAIQLPDPGLDSYFLSLFGRSDRTTACACERTGDVTMPQLLHLQNGDTVLAKIESGDGRLVNLVREQVDNTKLLEQLFLETLGRVPTPSERDLVGEQLAAPEAPREEVFKDLLWALLNSKEFTFNH